MKKELVDFKKWVKENYCGLTVFTVNTVLDEYEKSTHSLPQEETPSVSKHKAKKKKCQKGGLNNTEFVTMTKEGEDIILSQA